MNWNRSAAVALAAAACVTLAQPVAATAATGTPSGPWTAPNCTRVTGDGAVTFTTDGGATLTPTSGTLKPISYTHGLIALDTPNTLLATHNNELQRSTDAGCNWTKAANLGSGAVRLVAGVGNRAFGWQQNASYLVRVDGTAVTTLASPTATVVGVGTDRTDPAHVRVAGSDGRLYDSRDGGASWTAAAGLPFGEDALVYSVGFDPADPGHATAGAMARGGATTRDGGATWTPVTGLSATGGAANLFRAAYSPADPNTVYALGIDLGETTREGRHLFRSTDGGLSFSRIVDNTADTQLTNGTLLAPSPTDANVLHFEYGTYFQGYGTDLFRYDAATGLVSKTHNTHDGVSAIAFNPAQPGVMYLGLKEIEVDPLS
ncbi:dispase autolysis-inducing protein [Kitasatospora sp. NPDC091276]|uniref:WD40/YVTN/BNR-like repeat-containing protein n=1 Tax=Kitasatospora sp. NPDC091276 TaxID=3155300 RepID=UPI00343A427E